MRVKNILIVLMSFIPFLFLAITPSRAQVEDCTTSEDEHHPLRPYPGEICGPNATPDLPYCASRPWAVENFQYLRNIQGCEAGDFVYPCVNVPEIIGDP